TCINMRGNPLSCEISKLGPPMVLHGSKKGSSWARVTRGESEPQRSSHENGVIGIFIELWCLMALSLNLQPLGLLKGAEALRAFLYEDFPFSNFALILRSLSPPQLAGPGQETPYLMKQWGAVLH
ncbi:hypothetical protein KUCAC02_027492, partial [Chaenocephalus aceratus]